MSEISNHTISGLLAETYSAINKDMKKREFGVGDLVLRKAVGNAWDVSVGKLALNWEGP